MSFKDFIYRVKLPFQKDGELRRSLYHILGFMPGNIALYKQALVHKSAYGRKFQGQRCHNERLEFLGDAVLSAVVGDIVYHHFHGKPEGFLTNTRSKIVQRESLNRIASEIGLDRLIKSSDTVHNAHNSNLCGNAFEALVGAVYEDRGYECCVQFMKRRILKTLVNIDKVAYKEANFKSKLLEWSQKNRIRVDFDLVAEGKEGASSPTFVTDVVIEGINCGSGKGYTKKESQQLAARDALTKLKRQKGLHDEVFEAKSRRTAMDEQPQALLPELPEEMAPVQETEERKPKRVKRGSTMEKKAERKAEKRAEEKPEQSAAEQVKDKPAKQRKPKAKKEKPAEETKQPAAQPVEQQTKQETPAEQKPRQRRQRKSRNEKAQEPQAQVAAAADELPIEFGSVAMRRKTREEIIAEAEEMAHSKVAE